MSIEPNAPPPDPSTIVRNVADRYSGQAEAYRRHWAQILLDPGRALVERMPLSDARTVIEVGAGVGALLAELRRRAPQAFVLGADIAEGMIRLAPTDVSRVVMNAAALAVRDESFDAAVMAFMLFHVPDPSAGLTEVRRILRPGGTLGVATWEEVADDLVPDRIFTELLEEHGAAPDELLRARHDLMDTTDKVRDLLVGTGFDVIDVDRKEVVDRMDVDEFLARRTTLGVTKPRFASLAAPDRAACLQEARERLGGLTPEEFVAVDGAILAWARRPDSV